MSEPSVSRARLEHILIFIKVGRALAETKPAHSINRSAAKHPSLPGAPGSPDRLARFTARGIPSEETAEYADGKFAKILLAERILEMNMLLACFKYYLS